MHFESTDIEKMDRFYRANFINSATGYRPANLIGTVSADKIENLAIFSSVVHLGSTPALIGFIQRPITRFSHTYKNIRQTGYFTLNHVQKDFYKKAHFTSAKFESEVSEFEICGLESELLKDFPAPFVKASQVKIGLRFIQEIPITFNNTKLIIGIVEHLFIAENLLLENGAIAIDKADTVTISGLDRYFTTEVLGDLPYAKEDQLPDFRD